MSRTSLFLLLFGAAVVLLASTLAWYVYSFQAGQGPIGAVMGQMMGSGYAGGLGAGMPWYVGGLVALLALLAIAGVAGTVYYLSHPPIRTGPTPSSGGGPAVGMSWDALLRTSTPDEKKILDVLSSHEGAYLQKLIVKESGLSKLKTHRILSRMAERGIVAATRSGNTNEIRLADWLKEEKST